VTNCGDDVGKLLFAGLPLIFLVALLPVVYSSRRGQTALGCGGALVIGLLTPIVVALEPFYIGFARPLLDCDSLTRVPLIVGAAPLLLLVVAGAMMLLIRGD